MNNGITVSAQYQDDESESFMGNPLVEALPVQLSIKDLYAALQK